MTFPHFLDTATEYSSLVEGLTPNRDLHETLVLMEPVSLLFNYFPV